MDIDELINKTKSNSCENEYWLQLEKEILEFFKECSGEEKNKLQRKGQLEKVRMICSGIRYEYQKGID